MSIQNNGHNWKYEYTDQNDNRFYKLYDRQNKQLCVLNLRYYKDELNDHINWEMWKSLPFCVDEDHAEGLLEYYDSGIYGHGFVSCLVDSVNYSHHLPAEGFPNTTTYKLHKDQEFA